MNALARLIKSRMAELGLTYAEIGKRGGLPDTTVWALANKAEHRNTPRAVTLAKLAKGLGIPLDLVRSAAAEAAGYRIEEMKLGSGINTLEGAENVRIVVAAMSELGPRDQAKLRRLAQAFVDEVRADRDADEQ